VSWWLASFAIVAGVLIAGWLAYERARPSARMVAVVATLAALAALGRDAFVALPDVKPITAMTLVVGYALGPLPGFTVGAIGMFASNLVLGQGPYTPWQMAAWGLVGLAGALLGRASGRRLGRVGLACACAATALGAKEIMNLYTWTLGAAHTLPALLATAGAALPFDITDTVASFLFGLAFAPELARLLGRMRARMDVEWKPVPPGAAASLVLVGALLAVAPAHAGAVSHAAVRYASGGVRYASGAVRYAGGVGRYAGGAVRYASGVGWSTRAREAHLPTSPAGVAYLARAQNRDGGFGAAPGGRSSELYSAWAAIGLAAAGRDPLTVERGGHTLLDSMRAQAATLEGAGDIERTILAVRACGVPVGAFPGDLLGKLLAARASDGSFGGLVNITSFAIFALRAAGRPAGDPVVRGAGRWLARQQSPDGGFGYGGRGGSEDVDDTAAALQGVIDAGVRRGPVVAHAVRFLRRAQNPDGGYPQQAGDESNAQSTAWAVQGLIAAGENADAVKRDGSRSPLAYLRTLVVADGSVRYSRTSAQTPVWVTAQALTALGGKPFPVAPVPSRAVAHRASVGVGERRAGSRASAPTARSKHADDPAGAPARAAGIASTTPARLGTIAIAHAVGVLADVIRLSIRW
jgi:hypothetical protein